MELPYFFLHCIMYNVACEKDLPGTLNYVTIIFPFDMQHLKDKNLSEELQHFLWKI